MILNLFFSEQLCCLLDVYLIAKRVLPSLTFKMLLGAEEYSSPVAIALSLFYEAQASFPKKKKKNSK